MPIFAQQWDGPQINSNSANPVAAAMRFRIGNCGKMWGLVVASSFNIRAGNTKCPSLILDRQYQQQRAQKEDRERKRKRMKEREKAPRRDASSLPLSVQKEIAQHFLAPIGTG